MSTPDRPLRKLGFLTIGHQIHHLNVIKERYSRL